MAGKYFRSFFVPRISERKVPYVITCNVQAVFIECDFRRFRRKIGLYQLGKFFRNFNLILRIRITYNTRYPALKTIAYGNMFYVIGCRIETFSRMHYQQGRALVSVVNNSAAAGKKPFGRIAGRNVVRAPVIRCNGNGVYDRHAHSFKAFVKVDRLAFRV